MDVREIREMADEEILEAIEEQKRGLWRLRFDTVTGEVKDTNTMKHVRRDIARLKTVLRERQLAANIAASEDEHDE